VLLGIRHSEISVLDSAAVERANSVAKLVRKGELSNPIPSVGENHVQVLDAAGQHHRSPQRGDGAGSPA
jgi:hypothetical protein